MGEVKYNPSHHSGATPEARIAARLRNSGAGANPDHTVQQGNSPTRAYVNIHHSGHQHGLRHDQDDGE
jgi:hypothetical protein